MSYRRAARWSCVWLLAMGTAWNVTLLESSGPPLAVAVGQKEDSGFVEKMKKWQDQMTDKFRDSWKKSFGGKKDENTVATASVDLREQRDSYMLRFNLPNRDLDKVEIRLDRGELHIVAPAEAKVGRYEQTFALSNVPPDVRLQIERKQKDNVIVVTVPKEPSTENARSSSILPDPALSPLSDWDRDVFSRMDKMRREMDRIFDESFREFRSHPEHKGVFDRPSFGSSLNLEEEGEKYVVRAYLPEHEMKNVNVTVENRTVLRIEAKAEDREEQEEKGAVKSHKVQYAQIITLPGPVDADKMKVDKKEGMVVVTLPKQK